MSKIVRLTETDLMRLVKRVMKEQSEMGRDPFKKEGGSDPVSKEGGRDFDHFGKIVLPQMKAAGFRLVDESKTYSSPFCRYYSGNCCKYFVYPKHSNGVNLGLQCEDDGWKYVVYTHPGSKNVREFKWLKGTNEEVKNAAQQAVDYAIQLKNKMYPSKGSMQEQSSKPKFDCNLLKEIPRQGRKDLKGAFAQGFKPNDSDWQERIKILGNMPKLYQIDTNSSVALRTVRRCKPAKSKVEVIEFQKGNEYITYIGTD